MGGVGPGTSDEGFRDPHRKEEITARRGAETLMPAQVNRALVMSGGGAKGAFQVGALRHLIKDLGLDFQVIAGVSTGSLSAALLAQGKGPEGLIEQYDRLESLWLSIRSNDDIYKKRFLGKLLLLFFRDSIYSSEPLRKKLSDSVNLEKLHTSGKELRIGSVCFETGAYRTASQEDDAIREWTLGSSSMPLMFPPVRIGASTAVDGGVRNVTPLGDAFAALK